MHHNCLVHSLHLNINFKKYDCAGGGVAIVWQPYTSGVAIVWHTVQCHSMAAIPIGRRHRLRNPAEGHHRLAIGQTHQYEDESLDHHHRRQAFEHHADEGEL